ncbi:MAG TPA: DUF6691 family protein [Parasegetibacter sp.]
MKNTQEQKNIKITHTDFEVQSLDPSLKSEGTSTTSGPGLLKYLLAGIIFGITLVKTEVVSWFRIQEMFRFQSFHMYGVIGTAVVVAMISVFLIKKFQIKTISGESVQIPKKKFNKGQIYGGLIFGLGWAMAGACPGPLFAQIGMGFTVVSVVLLSAVAGTWVYGLVRDKLPH